MAQAQAQAQAQAIHTQYWGPRHRTHHPVVHPTRLNTQLSLHNSGPPKTHSHTHTGIML